MTSQVIFGIAALINTATSLFCVVLVGRYRRQIIDLKESARGLELENKLLKHRNADLEAARIAQQEKLIAILDRFIAWIDPLLASANNSITVPSS